MLACTYIQALILTLTYLIFCDPRQCHNRRWICEAGVSRRLRWRFRMKPSISHMATAIFITLRLSLRAPDRARRLETVVLVQSKVDPRSKKQPRFKFWRFLVLFMVAPHRRFAACPSRIVKFVKILPSCEVESSLRKIKKNHAFSAFEVTF